jgi:CRISPR-associated protein Csm1
VQAEEEPPRCFHPLHSLRSTRLSQSDLFPTPEVDFSDFNRHLDELAQALIDLTPLVEADDFSRLYNHLLATLQRYAYCLAAHSSDVALFDHLRLTGAIAACLYRYHESELGQGELSLDSDEEKFGLVLGDLSGIQAYIFGITTIGAGGVARRLRARSLRLSMISDGISHLIAQRFRVPLGNVIMASGGRFYVLVPKAGDIADSLQAIQHEVDAWLREMSNGEVATNLTWATFSGEAFAARRDDSEGFGDVVTELSRGLAVRKRRRAQSVLQDENGWQEGSFAIERDFWGRVACPSCEKFPAEEGGVCEHCDRDVGLGRVLPEARYIAYFRQSPSTTHTPLPGSYAFALLTEGDLGNLSDEPYLLTQLNDPDLASLHEYPASFRFLATYVPVFTSSEDVRVFGRRAFERREPRPSDFERWGIEDTPEDSYYPRLRTFAALADASQGRPLLGYIKADVDHLGLIFAQGLRREDGTGYDTAPHQAMLSRQMDWFFSGYIQHMLSQDPAYENVYTIFSGGDDLFLVAPWDQAADLARDIYGRFRDFAGQNPELTLSAGILFTKDRYPISRAAEDAERSLERSKELKWREGDGNRDQLTVLGDTFRWDKMKGILGEIERLLEWKDEMPSAFLHDLVEYWQLYRLWKDEKNVKGLRYKPLFAYNIARNLRRGDPDLYRWADGLMQALHAGTSTPTMQHLGLIATYVLYARRARS